MPDLATLGPDALPYRGRFNASEFQPAVYVTAFL